MVALKHITAAEARRIKKLWNKGDRLGVKLVPRCHGAEDNISLPLDPVKVKGEWGASRTRNPYKRAQEFAIAVGASDLSFLEWFALAAPDSFEAWLDELQGEGVFVHSEAIKAWADQRRDAGKPVYADPDVGEGRRALSIRVPGAYSSADSSLCPLTATLYSPAPYNGFRHGHGGVPGGCRT